MGRALKAGLIVACDDRRLLGVDLHPVQRQILEEIESSRLSVLACGRRSGKSLMCALVAVWDCTLRPELDAKMRPGETRFSICIAVNHQQARLTMDAAKGIAMASPGLASLITGDTENEIRFELPTGAKTSIRALPCSSAGARGLPISSLTLDEIAHFIGDRTGDQAAEQVFTSLVPSLSQFGSDARILLASTPWGADGFFFETFNRVESGELPNAAAFQFSTEEVNPNIDRDLLAQEKARDPQAYEAEYEAKFVSGEGAFIDFTKVKTRESFVDPDDGRDFVLGLDPGFKADRFGISAVGVDHQDPYKLLVGSAEALPRRLDFASSVAAVVGAAKRFNTHTCITDQFSSTSLAEKLRAEGLNVRVETLTGQTKTAIYGELRTRFYAGQLEVPRDRELLHELQALRSRFSGAAATVTAPRTTAGHSDRAAALALGTWAHRRPADRRRMARTGGYSGVGFDGEAVPPAALDM